MRLLVALSLSLQSVPRCKKVGVLVFKEREMDTSGYTHPFFRQEVGGGKMQTSSPPVIIPNRSQSNPADMITLPPRPIQSVGMDLHDVWGTSTGQTLPRERRAPPGTHFCPTIWWVYPHSATISQGFTWTAKISTGRDGGKIDG